MREIKFRAWDKRSNKFKKNHYLVSTIRESTISVVGVSEYQGDEDFFEDGIILMQYTGLKDKNGKDIWEDDRFRSHLSAGKSVGTIKYSEDGFKVIWDEPNYGCLNDILRIHAEDGEVIGNIYESPSEVTP